MKAMVYPGYGDPSVMELVDVPQPYPSSQELLVRVRAASVNPVDWKLHNGSLRFLVPVAFPAIPGFDFAGEVVSCGLQAHGFQRGDRVIAYVPNSKCGACAEYAVVDSRCAAKLPEQFSFHEGAALPLAGTTALQALRNHGQLQCGQRLLILGAAGGVGTLALQIAKTFGAEVTACCSRGNFELVARLGGDRFIDYRARPELGVGGAYDLILDCVGTYRFSKLESLMTPSGTLVALLPSAEMLLFSMTLPLYSKKRLHFTLARSNAVDLEFLIALMSQDRLRTVIDSTYGLSQLPRAYCRNQSGHCRGKIVINVP